MFGGNFALNNIYTGRIQHHQWLSAAVYDAFVVSAVLCVGQCQNKKSNRPQGVSYNYFSCEWGIALFDRFFTLYQSLLYIGE